MKHATSFLATALILLAPALAEETSEKHHLDALAWRELGPANMSGRIVDLAVVESDPSTYYAATASGGLLKTINNGSSFEHLFDTEDTVSIGSVAVSASNPDIVWIGTGEQNPRNSVSYGNGVYKSMDGGKTWEHKGLEESFQIGRVLIHPEDPDTVYIGALGRLWGPNEQRGLFKTTDGGDTWDRILYIDDMTGIIEACMHPQDPDTLLVATYERERDGFDTNDPAKKIGPGSGLYKTTDGGATFQKITQGLPTCELGRIGLNYHRGDPNIVYALIESADTGLGGPRVEDRGAYMGITGADAEVGARIATVTEEGPAAAAGIKAEDIVIGADGKPILSYLDLVLAIRAKAPDETMAVQVSRDRQLFELEVTFAERPDNTEASEQQRPYGTFLGGQIANIQDKQGEDGYQTGGVFKSTDGGESWTRINSLNPRPMYFSKIYADPENDDYLYVLGVSLHKSDDNGVKFTGDGGAGGVHVDHHALWINPNDGRHIILGNDGGIYVTYDRMKTWEHHNKFAISQFYHVTTDNQPYYRVYGGLQDNGTWGANARSGRAGGPTNEDWMRIGGGDGFICAVDRDEPNIVYYSSQNGGIGRRDTNTGAGAFLRPRPPRGTSYRWNWKTPFQLSHHNTKIYYTAGNYVFRSLDMGNDMRRISPEISLTDRGAATAISESPLNPDIIYVGTNDGAVWMTKDGGANWIDLLNPPAAEADDDAAERPAITDPISGEWNAKMDEGAVGEGTFVLNLELVDESTLKGRLDSPYVEGEFDNGTFAGNTASFVVPTDQGEVSFQLVDIGDNELAGEVTVTSVNMQLGFTAKRDPPPAPADDSDDGDEDKSLGALLPGPRWVSTIDASHHEEGRVYISFMAHKANDDRAYVLVSEDYGITWTSLSDDLPDASTRCVREDIENPNLLYVGTEFALQISLDRGKTWTDLNTNLPTVAVHEVAQHPTEGEIVAGTHGRGLWALNVRALRQMNDKVERADGHMFAPGHFYQWRSEMGVGRNGLQRFVGDNGPPAPLYYWLEDGGKDVTLRISSPDGQTVRELEGPADKGLNHINWDLRSAPREVERGGQTRTFPGRTVRPGLYDVTLVLDGRDMMTQRFEVAEDPRN